MVNIHNAHVNKYSIWNQANVLNRKKNLYIIAIGGLLKLLHHQTAPCQLVVYVFTFHILCSTYTHICESGGFYIADYLP